jgi:hypothetical protein
MDRVGANYCKMHGLSQAGFYLQQSSESGIQDRRTVREKSPGERWSHSSKWSRVRRAPELAASGIVRPAHNTDLVLVEWSAWLPTPGPAYVIALHSRHLRRPEFARPVVGAFDNRMSRERMEARVR